MWNDLDVAVVGGGPAGLAVALALKTVRPDLNLKVFEASPSYTPQGAGVGVFNNGVRALEAIDPSVLHRIMQDAFLACAFYTYSDETGERMPWHQGNDPRKNFMAFQAPWNTLRTSLYASIPEDTVVFGCKILSCTCQDSAASGHTATASSPPPEGGNQPDIDIGKRYTLRMVQTVSGGSGAAGRDGTGPQEVCATARYVIAADGYFSRIRRTACDGKMPTFAGTVRWLGTFTREELGAVPLPSALTDEKNVLAAHTWMSVAPDRPLTGRPTRGLLVYSTGADADSSARLLIWSLFAPVEALEATGEAYPMPPTAEAANSKGNGADGKGADSDGSAELSVQGSAGGSKYGARALQRALAVAPYLPADVRAMLAATPSERVMEAGIYIQPPETYQPGAWARDGILLVGDAAHAARPDGQGANLAFEDAALLGALVREHGLGPQTFAKWEAARQPRARDILHDATPSGALRMAHIAASSFEPLWNPADLAAAPGGPLPEEVAAEVRQVLEAHGEAGFDTAKKVILAWSQAEMRRMVEEKVADRYIPETVAPPEGSYRFR